MSDEAGEESGHAPVNEASEKSAHEEQAQLDVESESGPHAHSAPAGDGGEENEQDEHAGAAAGHDAPAPVENDLEQQEPSVQDANEPEHTGAVAAHDDAHEQHSDADMPEGEASQAAAADEPAAELHNSKDGEPEEAHPPAMDVSGGSAEAAGDGSPGVEADAELVQAATEAPITAADAEYAAATAGEAPAEPDQEPTELDSTAEAEQEGPAETASQAAGDPAAPAPAAAPEAAAPVPEPERAFEFEEPEPLDNSQSINSKADDKQFAQPPLPVAAKPAADDEHKPAVKPAAEEQKMPASKQEAVAAPPATAKPDGLQVAHAAPAPKDHSGQHNQAPNMARALAADEETTMERLTTPTAMRMLKTLEVTQGNKDEWHIASGVTFKTKRLSPDDMSAMVDRLCTAKKVDEAPGKLHAVKLVFNNNKETYVPVKESTKDENIAYMSELYTRCQESRKKTEQQLADKYLQPLTRSPHRTKT